MRKQGGHDHGTLYAMKVLKKASIIQKKKTAEHTMTERQVLEAVRESPFLVTLHYAFQTDAKLHLILGKCALIRVPVSFLFGRLHFALRIKPLLANGVFFLFVPQFQEHKSAIVQQPWPRKSLGPVFSSSR